MAVKTMNMSTGTGLYNVGWHEVTIRQATQGVWNGPKGSKHILIYCLRVMQIIKIFVYMR